MSNHLNQTVEIQILQQTVEIQILKQTVEIQILVFSTPHSNPHTYLASRLAPAPSLRLNVEFKPVEEGPRLILDRVGVGDSGGEEGSGGSRGEGRGSGSISDPLGLDPMEEEKDRVGCF